jgi:heme/copper-type cytochrome/quinol oxidase subunit 4
MCLLETYLISKISLIGKIGIAIIHKEYRLLRSGWKTFLLFLTIHITIIVILALIKNKKTLKLTAFAFLAIALIGLIVTYLDFLHTYSHRLLKERFHLGFYLFWFSWITSCIFFLLNPSIKRPETDLTLVEDPANPLTQDQN